MIPVPKAISPSFLPCCLKPLLTFKLFTLQPGPVEVINQGWWSRKGKEEAGDISCFYYCQKNPMKWPKPSTCYSVLTLSSSLSVALKSICCILFFKKGTNYFPQQLGTVVFSKGHSNRCDDCKFTGTIFVCWCAPLRRSRWVRAIDSE